MDRLTDAYIDRLIDKATFEARKATVLMNQKTLEEKIAQPKRAVVERLVKFLELAGDAYLLYKTSLPEEKRDLVKILTSNRSVTGKNVAVALKTPFAEVANRYVCSNSSPYRDRPRTLDVLLDHLITWFTANPTASFEVGSTLSDKHSSEEIDRKKGKHAA
jgi:hypothetical protein